MNLLDQLGGADQLDGLIELHNKKVLSDERVSRFFEGVDMTAREIVKSGVQAN